MTISILFPRWLARRFARPRPGQKVRPHLKIRQVLPTLPKNKRTFARFQDDNSPAGGRIQWRQ